MRAILDLRTNRVLRLPGSAATAMRTYAMLQIERDKLRDLCSRSHRSTPAARDFKLAIVELSTARTVGNIVPAGEFTIIHGEKQ